MGMGVRVEVWLRLELYMFVEVEDGFGFYGTALCWRFDSRRVWEVNLRISRYHDIHL
jgi:hypothetical protein